MRYLFRGMIRTNGRIVEGNVEAPTPEEAYAALSDNGIVTESLRPDPRPQQPPEPQDDEADDGAQPGFRKAIDSALDSASQQVSFDSLTEQYRGKKVWVLDRDKIRKRVAEVVDQVLAEAQRKSEGELKTRELVAEAIKGMFADNRNIASERSAESIAAERAAAAAERAAASAAAAAQERAAAIERAAADRVAIEQAAVAAAAAAAAAAGPAGQGKPLPASAALEAQIARLSQLVIKAEGALGGIIAASRKFGRGGGGGGGRRTASGPMLNEQNEVLLEIFKTNLALQHGIEGEILDVATTPGGPEGDAGAGAGTGESTGEGAEGAEGAGGADGSEGGDAAGGNGATDGPFVEPDGSGRSAGPSGRGI